MKYYSQNFVPFCIAIIFGWAAPCPAVGPRAHIDQCANALAQLNISLRPSESFGDLDKNEVAMIQAAVDSFGHPLYVTGSAARSERRGKGTDLPLGEFGKPKDGTKSDIDYAVANGLDERGNTLKLPDVDASFAVRGVDYLNLDKGPVIRFRPHMPPDIITGSGRLYLVGEPK